MTLNQQIALIEQFAANHAQINLTRFDTEYNVHGIKQQNGFVLWYFVETSQISSTSLRTPFVFTCMDVINEDRSNLADVLSDSLQILLDLEAYMLYYGDELDEAGNQYNFDIERSGSFEPGESMFNQYYAGHTVRLTFVQGYNYDKCAIPDRSIPAPTTDSYLLLQNGDFLLQQSGFKIILN